MCSAAIHSRTLKIVNQPPLLFLTSILYLHSFLRKTTQVERKSTIESPSNNLSSAPSPNQYPVICRDVRKLAGERGSYSRGAPHQTAVKSLLVLPHLALLGDGSRITRSDVPGVARNLQSRVTITLSISFVAHAPPFISLGHSVFLINDLLVALRSSTRPPPSPKKEMEKKKPFSSCLTLET